MARRKLIVVDEATETAMNELDELIPQYGENKAILDDYKKICDSENARIKELMDDATTHEVGSWKATKSVQHRESMNEEKLLDVASKHSYYLSDIIKTKRYIDMDVLEALIYKGLVPKDVLMEIDKCRETKDVVTLKITKIKEKKNA